jgi:hypothetical protein
LNLLAGFIILLTCWSLSVEFTFSAFAWFVGASLFLGAERALDLFGRTERFTHRGTKPRGKYVKK